MPVSQLSDDAELDAPVEPAAPKVMPLADDAPIDTPDLASQASQIVRGGFNRAKDSADKYRTRINDAMGKDPDVDYNSGLSFMDQVEMGRLDNDKERRMYLESAYGPDKIGTDTRGRLYVNKDGNKTSASGGDAIKGIVADMTGSAYPMIGGALGGALGLASPIPGGAYIGAGLGAAAGENIDQIVKNLRGYQSLSLPEQAKAEATEGALGAGGEMIGRGVAAIGDRLTSGRIPKFIGGQTPESDRLTALTLEGGARPPPASTLPEAKRLQWHYNLADKLGVLPSAIETQNVAYLDNQTRKILRASGVPEDQLDTVFQAVTNPKSAISTQEMGEDIQRSVRARKESLERISTEEMGNVDKEIDRVENHLNTLMTRYKPGDLGVDVAGAISDARKMFSRAMEKPYARVDQMVGDDPLVPTGKIKQQTERLWDSIPKTADGSPVVADSRVVTVLNQLRQLGPNMSFKDAQTLRTSLGDLGEMKDLVPGVSKRQYGDLQNSVEVALKLAGDDPRAAAAKRLLDAADEQYAKGIQKFNDTTVNKIVRDAQNGLPPDPSVVADLIGKTGYTNKTETIKNLIGPDMWRQVASQDWQNMIAKATKQTTDRGDVVDGKSLRNILQKRGPMLESVYGPRTANEIRTYADQLAVRDETLPVTNLQPGNFKSMVEQRQRATQALNDFMEKDYLSAFADPKRMPEDALKFIVKPGQETRLEHAVQFFGENSPQVQGIRKAAMQDLLSKANTVAEGSAARRIDPTGLENGLKQFTEKQQELLFPNGIADDLRLIAQEAKFLFPKKEGDMSAGLAAGAIKSLPLGSFYMAAAMPAAVEWLLTKPNVIRFYALGLRQGGEVRQATLQAMRDGIRNLAIGAQPDTQAAK